MKKPQICKKRYVLSFLLFVLLFSSIIPALASKAQPRRVFMAEETEPFLKDSELLEIYVAPLLGADCLLLGTGGEWMLVDMGKSNDYPVIRTMLDNLEVRQIDIAFNTHPHSDHIGSMIELSGDFEIKRFITTYPADIVGRSIRQRSTLNALYQRGIPIDTLKDGDEFTLGKAKMKVMKEKDQDVNASSAALHVSFGDTSFFLAADINRLSQGKLAQRYQMKADVLKYPHHGQEKLNQLFSESVSPEFAVFTHGSINTKEGQMWLDRDSVAYVFATWGLIHIQSDGHKIIVSQELKEEMQQYRADWDIKKQH